MSRKYGIGIVGLGNALRPHALSLKDLSGTIEVRAIFSRAQEAREKVAAEYDFPAANSLEDILDDDTIDAVLILTPPNARKEIVEQAARAGKHILMEKPVERTTEAAENIVAICEKHSVSLGIIFQHRFREGAVALRRKLDSGELGTLCAAWLTVPWWRPQSYYEEPGRGTLAQDGGGVLITQAIHAIDLMLSMTGQAAEAAAIARTTRVHQMETEDFVGAGLIFANGAPGGLIATTAAMPGFEEELVLICEKATARFKGGVLSLDYAGGGTDQIGVPTGSGGGVDRMAFPHDWHRSQIAEFFDSIANDRDPQSSGRTALATHYLIDALIRSAGSGRRTPVKQI